MCVSYHFKLSEACDGVEAAPPRPPPPRGRGQAGESARRVRVSESVVGSRPCIALSHCTAAHARVRDLLLAITFRWGSIKFDGYNESMAVISYSLWI